MKDSDKRLCKWAVLVLWAFGLFVFCLASGAAVQPFEQPVHGYFYHATDASGLTEELSRFALYDNAGTAITLGASDVVIVEEVHGFSAGTNAEVDIYDGADNAPSAGEQIAALKYGTINFANMLVIPGGHVCSAGTYPKVKASLAGETRFVLHGRVRQLR